MPERFFITRDNKFGGSTRVSLMDDDFLGSASRIVSKESFWEVKYPLREDRDFWSQKVIDFTLTWTIRIETSTQEDFYKSLRNAPEDRYKIRIQKDTGSGYEDDLIGYLKPGMISISKGGLPKTVKLRAKGLPGKQNDFDLYDQNTFENLISTIAIASGSTLPIYTYDDLIIQTTTGDFFEECIIDRHHLRRYKSGSSQDTAISNEDALSYLLPDGCFMIQHSGAWHIYYLPYIARQQGVDVDRYEYDSAGVFQVADEVNLVNDVTGENYVLPSSSGDFYQGLKFINQTFNHSTLVNTLSFDESYTNENSAQTKDASTEVTNLDGQRVNIQGNVGINVTGTAFSGEAYLSLRVGDYWYNGVSWTQDEEYVTINASGNSGDSLSGSINFTSEPIPNDVADGAFITKDEIRVDFRWGSVPGATINEIEFYDFSGRVFAPTGNSASINYRLSQTEDFSGVLDLPDRIYGQGPTGFARSSYRHTTNIPASVFSLRGGADSDWAPLMMGQIMSTQREGIEVGKFDLWADFNVGDVLNYDGSLYFFLSGSFTGRTHKWRALAIEMNYDNASYSLREVDELIGSSGSSGAVVDSVGISVDRASGFSDSQKITTISADVSGTVTTIPIDPVGETFMDVGDTFYLFNMNGASVTEFVLAEPQLPDATDLIVESKVLSETIVAGSWVIFTGDRIANYLGFSDSGIRLGVRSYSQATTEDGEAYVDQDGNGYMFVDDGDQTAVNQHTTSEIAILRGEIVLKATAGGQLALVRLDAKPESGSVITIKADNIDLDGLVTAINSDTGSKTEIDGGKIKADTSVIVGTGDDVAALTGAHPSTRIYAGNSDPDAAPFRVSQTGEVFGTKFVKLSGEEVDGVIEQFSIKDLEITGDLTIGAGGKLRTASDETIFGEDGISFDIPDAFANGASLVWVSGTDNAHIGAYFSGGAPKLEYKSRQHEFVDENDTQLLLASSTQFTINNVDAMNIDPSALATSDPNISGRVWNNNGVLTLSAG